MHPSRHPFRHRSRSALLAHLAVLLIALFAVEGCAVTIVGRPVSGGGGVVTGPVDTSIVQDGDENSPVDRVATATLLDLQTYWRDSFEPAFGHPWRDLSGGFHSVDTTNADAPLPPCVTSALKVEGNAYYCPSADAIAWDRSALLPVLRERYGDSGVMVVLAHEFGHAVHTRLGIESGQNQRGSYPTIVTEAMADCYAGSFVRWVTDGKAGHLRLDQQSLDLALSALVTFRDPVGISAADAEAHGNAFDRASAFQDGYRRGPRLCSDFTASNRIFTQQRFTNVDDLNRRGNLPFDRLLQEIVPDLETYFTEFVTAQGGQWTPPQVRTQRSTPDCTPEQGPTAFCPAEDIIELDGSDQLPKLHRQIGDYATATLLASRYSLAALAALDRPTTGEEARRAALCLTGTYTGTLLRRETGFGLSPGDLDEAVQVLVGYDYASRDVSGQGLPSGFERVDRFRAGALDGPDACGR